MNKEEIEQIAEALIGITQVIDQLDEWHKKLTDLLIQKGDFNVKDTDCFDWRRN